jgi:hypothetical protein
VKYHFILTLQAQSSSGRTMTDTFTGTWVPLPGESRSETYAAILARCKQGTPAVDAAVTMFFSLEPDNLEGS